MGLLTGLLIGPDTLNSVGVAVAVVLATFVLIKTLTFIYSIVQLWLKTRHQEGPRGLPLLGVAHMLKDEEELVAQLSGWSNRYGKLWGLWIGTEYVVVANSPETVQEVMKSTEHITKSFLYDFLHPWLRTGLLTSGGDKWRQRRRLLTPAFHHMELLKDSVEVFREHATMLTEEVLEGLCEEGTVFDMFDIAKKVTLDVMCEAAMGYKLGVTTATEPLPYYDAMGVFTRLVHLRQRNPLLHNNLLYSLLPAGRKSAAAVRTMHAFTDKVIRERRALLAAEKQQNGGAAAAEVEAEKSANKRSRRRMAFLDMLFEARQENGEPLSHTDIREEVDTFMFEGHDTTAAAITWCLHLLGNHPDIQEEVYAELEREVAGDVPEFEEVKKLSLLENCAKEALRLYPSVPGFARRIRQDDVLGGDPALNLPKGASCLVWVWGLHRDPRHWHEPEKFDPHRFDAERSKGRNPFAYIPFSAGQRNCVGARFARLEERVMLAAILKRFRVVSKQPTTLHDLKPLPEIILRPKNGSLMVLERR